ncbi:hypothetical protein PFLUV_G00271470 [Perca fluviatilis]|uniref:Uncharacterized protein n=1 Tax=Perca fluviatilis TaxID=8168 RepID=A0A6A5DWG1_PERFL|nr:hypothetical protein PFLUV_G00271470 [Perca fluviatilis]
MRSQKRRQQSSRRLHNSETNCSRRYEPEQGLTSTHNEAVTYICSELSASPDLHDADNDAIVSACKTHYETARRSFS